MRYRLRTLFVLITLLAIVFAVPNVWHKIQFRRFVSYSNRDLRTLGESELQEFSEIYRSVIPRENESTVDLSWSHVPWYVWSAETTRGTRYLYLRGSPCYRIPGISMAHIHVFDSKGRIVSKTEFSTGYRITINDAAIHDATTTDFMFRIESEPVINGRGVAAQYYVLFRDQILLVRLEDGKGLSIENDPNNMKIGNDAPEFISNNWKEMLENGRRVERLLALAYLQIAPQPGTIELLESLSNDRDKWIADSARLAVQLMPWEDRGITLKGAERVAG